MNIKVLTFLNKTDTGAVSFSVIHPIGFESAKNALSDFTVTIKDLIVEQNLYQTCCEEMEFPTKGRYCQYCGSVVTEFLSKDKCAEELFYSFFESGKASEYDFYLPSLPEFVDYEIYSPAIHQPDSDQDCELLLECFYGLFCEPTESELEQLSLQHKDQFKIENYCCITKMRTLI